ALQRRLAQQVAHGAVRAPDRELSALARRVPEELVDSRAAHLVRRAHAERDQRLRARQLLGELPVLVEKVSDDLRDEPGGDGRDERALGQPLQRAVVQRVHAEQLDDQRLDGLAVYNLAEVVVLTRRQVVDRVGQRGDEILEQRAATDP